MAGGPGHGGLIARRLLPYRGSIAMAVLGGGGESKSVLLKQVSFFQEYRGWVRLARAGGRNWGGRVWAA
jgi:ABC-type transporter Mla maintaining outer membrane lipid asymmetry ATPase subunit MlaF